MSHDLYMFKDKVITQMGLDSNDPHFQIRNNVESAVLELRTAGVIEPVIFSSIGVTAVSIICNDLLNVDSGNVKISPAYMYYLPILQAMQESDLTETTTS